MPVVGAVVTLSSGRPPPPGLGTDPRITVGDRSEDRLPIVIVTERRGEDRELLEQMLSWPAVADVQVAFADFSDLVEVSP